MSTPFVPDEFEVPLRLETDRFRLEPLGPEHNERDHAAWMSSVEHIRATPGFADWSWPTPMSLEENLTDLEEHAADFRSRKGFTYSVLVGDDVIGCVYIYPSPLPVGGARVRSWVTEQMSSLDRELWRAVSDWLASDWPFEAVDYADRPATD